jgi:hypothetical protein
MNLIPAFVCHLTLMFVSIWLTTANNQMPSENARVFFESRMLPSEQSRMPQVVTSIQLKPVTKTSFGFTHAYVLLIWMLL